MVKMIKWNGTVWSIILFIFLLTLPVGQAAIIKGEPSASTPSNCDNNQKCREVDEVWLQLQASLSVSNTILGKVWDPNQEWIVSSVSSGFSEEGPASLPTDSTIVSSYVINQILNAGGWTENADDTIYNEKLPWFLVVDMAEENPGLISLFFAVAEWGIDNPPMDLNDPENRNWVGTRSISDGKHLMSYKYGKLGIAHYVGSHIDSISELYGSPSNTSTDSPEWKNWARSILQRRVVQHYLIERWLEKFWTRAVSNTDGDVSKAIVNARIANSNPSDADNWGRLSAEQQMSEYANKHDEQDRIGTMRRAVAIYEYIVNHNLINDRTQSSLNQPSVYDSILGHGGQRQQTEFIVLHDGGKWSFDSMIGGWSRRKDRGDPVSSHYHIDCDGTLRTIISEDLIAWHAGCGASASNCYLPGINDKSVSIDLRNCEDEAQVYITSSQYRALNDLISELVSRYPGLRKDDDHIISHFEVGKHNDPRTSFDWSRVNGLTNHRENGYCCRHPLELGCDKYLSRAGSNTWTCAGVT